MASEMSQKERMIAGRLYYAIKDPELIAGRNACRALCTEYNATQGMPGFSYVALILGELTSSLQPQLLDDIYS